ncbi:probable acyl-CoA dehydrogenase 6 isoform X3 [Rhipicephalus sanguineus]|uniref:probable acyl-CoA dehydrogenase 6 isoform X3 n=1 Tax=Rhipicephalus sanguineus TaxID=34632 RepID=UPI00189536C2|nr:probable acyl-CoA dehydrogenase 6 isoform X3 [Rhipicephalus sanguineus]
MQALRLSRRFRMRFPRCVLPPCSTTGQEVRCCATFFTEQHDELRRSVRRVIDKDINPYVDQWEAEGMFDAHKVFKKLAEVGVLGITRPVEYGGLGLDYSFTVAFAEELSAINCVGIVAGILVQTDMCTPALANFGSDELKAQFLAPSISGDVVGCIGVSEPDSGSDVASIKTTAVRKGDDLVINGGKMWITNGCQADWMALLANTRTEGPSHKTKSLICLPLKTPGVTVARKIKKLGQRCSDTAQIFFEDVRVPAKNIVGEEGKGFIYQMLQFQEERLVVAIKSVPSMERMINDTLEYCRQRKVYGQPLIKNQVIQYRLAELQTEVEALRSLGYRAAAKLMSGENVTELASMAKLKAGRLLREVADTCLQYWGGMGYTEEMPMARAFRDSRLLSIGGGADEVMLSIIAKLRWGLAR